MTKRLFFKKETHEYFIDFAKVPSVTEIVAPKITYRTEALEASAQYGNLVHRLASGMLQAVSDDGKNVCEDFQNEEPLAWAFAKKVVAMFPPEEYAYRLESPVYFDGDGGENSHTYFPCAGTPDVVVYDASFKKIFAILDFKTGYPLAWHNAQLGGYAWLLRYGLNDDGQYPNSREFSDDAKVFDLYPNAEIEAGCSASEHNLQYSLGAFSELLQKFYGERPEKSSGVNMRENELLKIIPKEHLQLLTDSFVKITRLKKELEFKEEMFEEIKEKILGIMIEKNISGFEFSDEESAQILKFKKIDAHKYTRFDAKIFKEVEPDAYRRFCKTTTINPSLRVAIKSNAKGKEENEIG